MKQPSIRTLVIIAVALLLFAYLSPLGKIPLDTRGDESRRALVTAEMVISGDYVTPTLNGQPYFNKPPLYNWIIATFFYLAGGFSLFALRLPVILAVLAMGWAIYLFVKKYTGNALLAIVSALVFATNGRILIYDTLFGLIDLSFAVVVYVMMMLVFAYGEKKKHWHLFLITYILCAIAYLMKGLPGPAHLAITLIVYAVMTRNFKMLFSIQHIAGILLFFGLLGTYYAVYFSVNKEVTATALFTKLLSESTDRTVVKYGVWQTIVHFFRFPLTMLYHYAPWMLLLTAMIRKDWLRTLHSHPFIAFNWWAFLANFLLYWTSPDTYPRYLFPFLPLLFTVVCWFFVEQTSLQNWRRRIPEYILVAVLALIAIALLAVPFVPQVQHLSNYVVKSIALALGLSICVYFAYRHQNLRLVYVAIALLVIRVGFNWFVIENRGAYDRMAAAKADSITAITKGAPLYVLDSADRGNLDGTSFLIATRRNEILRIAPVKDSTAFYIADSASLQGKNYTTYLYFESYYAPMLQLVKFK
ncbi:MAG TPA: glycosyltransferase family 39 protein [Phnomibacter sp.]|nr:glycosyltransferase family 39 protein [Phnomibacter sp.]